MTDILRTRTGAPVAIALAAAVGALLALAPPADAQRVRNAMIQSYIPARIDPLIGFIPSHGMDGGKAPGPRRVRYGGRTWHFLYQNSAAVWPDTGLILRTLSRASSYVASASGAFVDRKLSASNRRRLVQKADLGREADVLVVAPDHPACTAGLTMAQARGIARGTIRRWSEVVALRPGQPDAIDVHVQTDAMRAMVPRWGVTDTKKFAPGARRAADGGLGAAAGGDLSVAGLTSWSRARRSRACAVPVNGVAPTGQTVFSLSYPAAYPILFVIHRAHARSPRESRAAMHGFIEWLKGPATEMFRGRGMLMTADGPPADAPTGPPPEEPPPAEEPPPPEE